LKLVRELLPLGRIGRRGFWLRHLVVLPVALFLCISAEQVVGRPLGLVAALATTLFLVSAWGRRLHDRGRSARWLLVAALPVLGALFLLVECGFLGSRPSAERFGNAPGFRADYVTV
jgi:uncharacterized membrane protein YhaH (DUF805 family)